MLAILNVFDPTTYEDGYFFYELHPFTLLLYSENTFNVASHCICDTAQYARLYSDTYNIAHEIPWKVNIFLYICNMKNNDIPQNLNS